MLEGSYIRGGGGGRGVGGYYRVNAFSRIIAPLFTPGYYTKKYDIYKYAPTQGRRFVLVLSSKSVGKK